MRVRELEILSDEDLIMYIEFLEKDDEGIIPLMEQVCGGYGYKEQQDLQFYLLIELKNRFKNKS